MEAATCTRGEGVALYISHRMCTRPVWKLLHAQEERGSHHRYHTGDVLGWCGSCYMHKRRGGRTIHITQDVN